ncbi:hypothetical protein [Pseudaminobacter salicylatoxidans]|nr:hypothetical protein [Pseudaminobacter salicylatoxidans]
MIDNVYKIHRLLGERRFWMSRSHQTTAKWHSVRGPLAPRRVRFGLEVMIFLLAFGFTVAVVFGFIG